METREEKVDDLLKEALSLMDNKLYERAMIEFSKAMSVAPKAVIKILDTVFQQCQMSGNYEGLITVGSNLLVHSPENSDLAIMLGNSYRRLENWPQAEKLYEHCLKYDSKSEMASYNWAASMARSDWYDRDVSSAISEFEKLTKIKLPDFEEKLGLLEDLQREILTQEAEQEAAQSEKGEEENEGDSAEDKEWQDDLEKSVDSIQKDESKDEKEKKIELEPAKLFKHIRATLDLESREALEVLELLGLYCLENDEPEIAWRAFTRVAFSLADNENIKSYLVLAEVVRQAPPQIELLIDFLGKYPHNRLINANLGFFYQQKEDKLLARKYFLIAQQYLNKSEGYYDMTAYRALGDHYVESEDYVKALTVYGVLREEYDSVELWRLIGELQIKLKQYQASVQTFKHLHQMAPDNEEVQEMSEELFTVLSEEADVMRKDRKFAPAAEFLEMCIDLNESGELIQNLVDVYQLMKNEKKVAYWESRLHQYKIAEKEREQELDRQRKIAEGNRLKAQHNYHKAINVFEEALRLKPDKSVFLLLVGLYRKTKRNDMVGDVTERYRNAVEVAKREAKYQQDQLRQTETEAETE